MKFYIIAGEASGDLHASNLMKELKIQEPSAVFRCWGGDRMKMAGGELVKHYRSLAFMGFTEVVLNLKTILQNIEFCKKDIVQYKPDALILVDYPGFNLRIAEFARKNSLKIFYYISPQVWAWKASRIRKIKNCVERMFCILPFEKEFYAKYNYEVDFVGHPLLDELQNRQKQTETFPEFAEKNNLSSKPIVALLPGSRKQEIEKMLPVMASLAEDFPAYQFVTAGVDTLEDTFYKKLIGKKNVKIIFSQTYDLLEHTFAALVTSGTATLETALFGVPQVVCYKGGMISYQIAKWLVKVNYISLVNLIMEKETVKELIQDNFNASNLKTELKKILDDTAFREKMVSEMKVLSQKLSVTGKNGASRTAARLILNRTTR